MPDVEKAAAGLPSLASFLRTEPPAVSLTDEKVKPQTKPPSPSRGAIMLYEEDKTAGTPSRASLLSTDCESTADKVSSSSSELTVYMAGKNQNLTKIRADIIEAEIIEKFSEVAKIEQSRSSLRILCKTEQQKELMLRGGSVAGVEVQVTEPRGMRAGQ